MDYLLNPAQHIYPRFDYLLYFRQLYRRYGLKSLYRQFRFNNRRPFSRGLIRKYSPSGYGIEIGVGFFTIAPLKRTILTDGFSSHGNDDSIATDFCKADEIPVQDSSFNFILSEHVLEHLCNPIRALEEWKRILMPNGKVFLFLPHKDRTFDRNRQRTKLAHLFEDHQKKVSDPDLTHLDDWTTNVVRAGLAPHYESIPVDKHPELGLIHHHVWVTEDICELMKALGFRILFSSECCPDRTDSFVVVAEKAATI